MGISQGVFREDLNVDMIAKIYLNLIEIAITLPVLNKFKFYEYYRETILYHLHAITSPKGLEYLKNQTTQLLNNNI